MSLENSPNRGSANHGGISRATTLALMARAHGRASRYESSGIGATWFGRWQLAQLSSRISPTCPFQVGVPSAATAGADASDSAITTPADGAIHRVIDLISNGVADSRRAAPPHRGSGTPTIAVPEW